MSRYPSESVERMDQQWAETEDERNARLADKRIARSLAGKLCSDCPPAEFPDAPRRCAPCPRRRGASTVEAKP
jgi:hypothetical protein